MVVSYEDWLKQNNSKQDKKSYTNYLYDADVDRIRRDAQELQNQNEANNRTRSFQQNEALAVKGLAGGLNTSPISGTSITSRTNLEMEREKNRIALQENMMNQIASAAATKQQRLFAIDDEQATLQRQQQAQQQQLAQQQQAQRQNDLDYALKQYNLYVQTGDRNYINSYVEKILNGVGITKVLPSMPQTPPAPAQPAAQPLQQAYRPIQTASATGITPAFRPLPTMTSGAEDRLPTYTPAQTQTTPAPLPSTTTTPTAQTNVPRPPVTKDNQVFPIGMIFGNDNATWGVPSGLTYRGNWHSGLLNAKVRAAKTLEEKRTLLQDFMYMAIAKQNGEPFSYIDITPQEVDAIAKEFGL